MFHRSNSVVAHARASALVVALACAVVVVTTRAESPAVGNRQATQVPVNVDQQIDVSESTTTAFADLQKMPGWLEDLLTPQGREAVSLMDQFFSGTSVQTQLDENASIRGRLMDTEPADRVAQARGGDGDTAKLSAAARQRAFDRFKAIARTQGSARVIVKLDVPNVDALTAQSVAATGANIAAAADQNLATAIRTVSDRELAKLAGTAHTVTHTYSYLPYVALDASEAALGVLEQSPAIIDIDEDALSRPVRWNDSMKQIGADVTRNEGFDGSGEYVAVFDTGVLASHEAFTGKDIVQACYATSDSGVGGDCPNGSNVDTTSANAAQPYPSDYEGYDHGTHVADIACGSDPNGTNLTDGGLQPNNGIWGVAPNAGLIAVQVFHKVDSRSICRTSDKCLLASSSDYIAAMNYIYSLRNTYSISSINMSLGGGRYTNQATCDSNNSATKSAIDTLRSVGIATVIAAGNDGYCGAISSPGCISSAIAVGAVDSHDNEANFSNFEDSMLDLYAPGVQIKAAVASGDNAYGRKSGTSMATPHVTGAWAVMKQNSPSASVDAVLAALQQSGVSVSGRCTDTPSAKRIQIDNAFFRHNGRPATLGSGEVAADFYWAGVPGAFISARRLYEVAPHEIRYFYETYLEPPVLTLEYAIRNDTDVSWSGYQMQLFGADFIGLDGGNRQGPQARANNPVVPDTGFSDGDILFMTRHGRITVAESWIERDGDNATLTVMFSEPVDPGESFMLAYFVDDVGMRDKSFEMISTPLE